jgi:hypothetical protein
MENEIIRRYDENLQQPRVGGDRIRTLYNFHLATGKPMTVLLDEAILFYADSQGFNYHPEFEEEPVLEKVDQQTWEEIREYRRFLDQLEYLRCLGEMKDIANRAVQNENRNGY